MAVKSVPILFKIKLTVEFYWSDEILSFVEDVVDGVWMAYVQKGLTWSCHNKGITEPFVSTSLVGEMPSPASVFEATETNWENIKKTENEWLHHNPQHIHRTDRNTDDGNT